ncbi:CGNR zinc finger domain-containing protein [Streptomyces sp. NPDC051243]|uniref:CGNR zinc finger domain-containing protein n=1 Tax=Streptomyces sp. NPDC051243 TaxID=3365646 RepID=UPI0037BB3255
MPPTPPTPPTCSPPPTPNASRRAAPPPCNRYLFRHGRRHWCSTRCGDRARAARAYARRTRPAAG